MPASRRAHELAALFAHGSSRSALALLWRYGLLDLLLPEHARWLAEARVPRRSAWKKRGGAGAGGGRGEDGDEEEDDEGTDDEGSSGGGGGEAGPSEAASLPPRPREPREGEDDAPRGDNASASAASASPRPPPPPPPLRLRSLPGVDSLAALDVAASPSCPAPPALWAAALAMPLVASAALSEEAKRERRRRRGRRASGGQEGEEEDEGDGEEEGDEEEAGAFGDDEVGDPGGSSGDPFPSAPRLPHLRRFRSLVHAAVETMGAGGHHHVPRAVRAGAEALILRAAAAELGHEAEALAAGGASVRTRRQRGGRAEGRDVWATVLAGAGRWAAIAEGGVGELGGGGGGSGGNGGGGEASKEKSAASKKKQSAGSRARASSAGKKT